MKIGKVPPKVLERSVFPFDGKRQKEVLVHSGFGEDCSVIDFGEDNVAVMSTDPITGADSNSGHLAVMVSCNDLAACGAKPLGILVTLLLPEGTGEEDLRAIMESIHAAASDIDVEVLGGHSEITAAVNKVVINATAVGIAKRGHYISSAGAAYGDDVIVTKSLGLEGAAILASDYGHFLKGKLPEGYVQTARGFFKHISVINDGLIAAGVGVSAMHDITEGGLLGACHEICEASGVGMELWEGKLPVLPETLAVCEAFKIDPLGLISSGSMLITSPVGVKVTDALKSHGIPATIIGKVIKDGRFIIGKDTVPIVPPKRDELYNAIETAQKSALK